MARRPGTGWRKSDTESARQDGRVRSGQEWRTRDRKREPAGPPPAEADLVDALRADPAAWLDGLSLVSVDEADRPVGHALRVNPNRG
ncbi:hypothetical protein [Streptomyces griseofuscus]|uniref:hypothetical protein n=1 Tax=Streptomyces griseofuscus TaxID=146922 RepID=UPI0038109A0F